VPFGLGLAETLLILGVVILFFGAKRLPEAAASLGKGIREFKGAVSGMHDEIETPANTVAAPPPPAQASATPAADPNVIAAPAPGRSETFAPSAPEPVVAHPSSDREPGSTPAATDRP
jgi:sec-independent protein translocase protein TatA